MLSRMFAIVIGTLALASLRGTFDALPDPMAYGPLAQKLWFMAGFFSILTNLGVAGLMFAVARGWRMRARWAAGMLAAVVIVAVVHLAQGSGPWAPETAGWWADQGLHIGVPLAVGLWWLAYADKTVSGRDLPALLAWPALYCAYALIRWNLTGVWPDEPITGDLLDVVRFFADLSTYLWAFVAGGLGL